MLQNKKIILPLKKENLNWAITDYDKTVLFGTYLAKVFQPHDVIPISPTFFQHRNLDIYTTFNNLTHVVIRNRIIG